ncbi:MAG TPA: cell division protein ZapD [Gammaproteobacteria bacterium]|nr:cell division protein ZapD [Gammaproteobacteria bacterium]
MAATQIPTHETTPNHVSELNTAIVYEHPLTERLRFFLRLEFLFRLARHSLRGEAVWDSHNSLAALLEILNIVSRVDMKTEVIKELERITTTLGALTQAPGVKHDTLDQLLTTLGGFKGQLHGMDGPLAQELRENELFKLVIQRSGIPGGLCDFDLPAYRHWLKQPAGVRIDKLRNWLASLDTLRLSVELMLKLIRESTDATPQVAIRGNYQQNLDTNATYQLIRIWLPVDAPYFVEISAGRHRFTARFMQASSAERPAQTDSDVDFYVSCCAL